MTKIANLLKIHDHYTPATSLPLNIGDGFLCSKNSFYSAIRQLALSYGLRFSLENSPLWRDYLAFSLFSLQRIVDECMLPYIDNVSIFRSLVESNPDFAPPARFLLEGLNGNRVFHESAHFVAIKALEPLRATPGALDSDGEWFVSYCLLSESFARAVERFAMFTADSDNHSLLLLFNSYAEYNKDAREIFAHAAAQAEIRQLFYLGMLGSLYSNISAEPLPDSTLHNFVTLSLSNFGGNTSDSRYQAISAFARLFASVSAGFRDLTTRSYFRLYRCEPEFDSSLISMLENPARLQWTHDSLRLLADILFSQVESGKVYEETEIAVPAG